MPNNYTTLKVTNITLGTWSLARRNEVLQWFQSFPPAFEQSMKFFLKGEYRLTQRLADVFTVWAETKPEDFNPYIEGFVGFLKSDKSFHISVKRNIIRLISILPMQKSMADACIPLCFDYLQDEGEANAVRVFSLTFLYRTLIIYPELENELLSLIHQILAKKPTKAMLSRIRKHFPKGI